MSSSDTRPGGMQAAFGFMLLVVILISILFLASPWTLISSVFGLNIENGGGGYIAIVVIGAFLTVVSYILLHKTISDFFPNFSNFTVDFFSVIILGIILLLFDLANTNSILLSVLNGEAF